MSTDSPDYLVWSNQHGMWWRGGERGYTSVIEEAGRYTKAHAESIVNKATCDGALRHERINPVTGLRYESFDEVAVPAPARIETEDVPF